jgi:hypothetical protein
MKQMALPFAIVGNRKGAWLVQKKAWTGQLNRIFSGKNTASELWNSQGNKNCRANAWSKFIIHES